MSKKNFILISLLLVITNIITSVVTYYVNSQKQGENLNKQSSQIIESVESETSKKNLESVLLSDFRTNKTYLSCMKTYNDFCSTQVITTQEQEKEKVNKLNKEQECKQITDQQQSQVCLDDYYLESTKSTLVDSCEKIKDKDKNQLCNDYILKSKLTGSNQDQPFNIRILKCSQIVDKEQQLSCKQTIVGQELDKLNHALPSIDKLDTSPCIKLGDSGLVQKCIQDYKGLKMSSITMPK